MNRRQRQPLTPEQVQSALSNPIWKAQYDYLRHAYGQTAADRYLETCIYPASNGGQRQTKRGAA